MSSNAEAPILSGHLDRIELGPSDYTGYQLLDGSEGREGWVCGPDDGRQVSAVGVFTCEPCTYVSPPLKADETVILLEGEIRLERDDGTAIELRAGDITVVPKGAVLTWIHKTPCKEVFVTCRP
jgi:uncharacterized cupin superfamily protein